MPSHTALGIELADGQDGRPDKAVRKQNAAPGEVTHARTVLTAAHVLSDFGIARRLTCPCDTA